MFFFLNLFSPVVGKRPHLSADMVKFFRAESVLLAEFKTRRTVNVNTAGQLRIDQIPPPPPPRSYTLPELSTHKDATRERTVLVDFKFWVICQSVPGPEILRETKEQNATPSEQKAEERE